jgi:hypothetical protein
MRNLCLLLGAALALSSCAQLPIGDVRACAGAIIASPATDFKSAALVAAVTPACSALAADLLQVALTQALAAKGR